MPSSLSAVVTNISRASLISPSISSPQVMCLSIHHEIFPFEGANPSTLSKNRGQDFLGMAVPGEKQEMYPSGCCWEGLLSCSTGGGEYLRPQKRQRFRNKGGLTINRDKNRRGIPACFTFALIQPHGHHLLSPLVRQYLLHRFAVNRRTAYTGNITNIIMAKSRVAEKDVVVQPLTHKWAMR